MPPPTDFDLTNEVAIVTGAGSRMPGEIGNGRATAIILARHGAKVALVDCNIKWAQETKRIIDAEGGISEVVHADVTEDDSCKDAVAKTVEMFGTVNILVNIVGVGGAMGDATKIDMAAWDRDFRINVTSMVLMCRYAIPEMRKNGRGAIVNMSSVGGRRVMLSLNSTSEVNLLRSGIGLTKEINLLRSGIGLTKEITVLGGNPSLLYPTTKGAIIQMTRAMAAQHGPENIRVNCVCPGMVFTPMVRGRGMTDEMRQARINQNLLKQEGTGWDVGYAVFFLCSKEARWITGLIMPVDAGTTAGRADRPALKADTLAETK